MGRPKLDKDLLEEIEELLITTDMGVETADKLIKKLKEEVDKVDFEGAVSILKHEIKMLLRVEERFSVDVSVARKPYVVLVIGVNGVGKTTTIAKLGYLFQQEGKRVMLCAGDTFRAAVEQLLVWGERLGVSVVSHGMHKDPGSVVYDAVDKALLQDMDVLLVDTAGRLHNKVGLMNELAKVKRVIGKRLSGAPQEVLLVLDGSTGQNAWQQARLFDKDLGITGLVVTKLDGVAKGGVLIGLASELGIPIKYVGLGEQVGDLVYFDGHDFVEGLFVREG